MAYNNSKWLLLYMSYNGFHTLNWFNFQAQLAAIYMDPS